MHGIRNANSAWAGSAAKTPVCPPLATQCLRLIGQGPQAWLASRFDLHRILAYKPGRIDWAAVTAALKRMWL